MLHSYRDPYNWSSCNTESDMHHYRQRQSRQGRIIPLSSFNPVHSVELLIPVLLLSYSKAFSHLSDFCSGKILTAHGSRYRAQGSDYRAPCILHLVPCIFYFLPLFSNFVFLLLSFVLIYNLCPQSHPSQKEQGIFPQTIC